ncbi:MAG: pyridoxal-phosphate-dependent aminotransferase family protein [Candidatus Heimdallarchaeota archaeon]
MPSERNLLMIPGPITFDPAVLRAMSTPTPSHLAPSFMDTFGTCLEQMREIFLSKSGQPFIIAGSGTLAMEFAVCNLIERGDHVLVCNSGYFGSRYVDICNRLGVQVDELKAEIGNTISSQRVKERLEEQDYKLVTLTQVDTSTAVLNPVKEIGDVVADFDTLLVVDGVCGAAAEETHFDAWNLDVYFTASQKAIGVPPGLALLMLSDHAIKTYKARKTPVASYYSDIANWLPIMQAYEERRPSYFGTPAVNLILALKESTDQILEEGMDTCFKRHVKLSNAVKAGIRALNLKTVPKSDEKAAHTLTAPFYPEGVDGDLFRAKMAENGVIVAGGLQPEIKTTYFRIGHMGRITTFDVLAIIGAVERALIGCNYEIEPGNGVNKAQQILSK